MAQYLTYSKIHSSGVTFGVRSSVTVVVIPSGSIVRLPYETPSPTLARTYRGAPCPSPSRRASTPAPPGGIRWRMTALAVAALVPCTFGSTFSAVAEVAQAQQVGPPATTVSSGWAGGKWGDAAADKAAKNAYGKNSAERDAGSLYTVSNAIGARKVWKAKDSLGRPDHRPGCRVWRCSTRASTGFPGLDGVAQGDLRPGPVHRGQRRVGPARTPSDTARSWPASSPVVAPATASSDLEGAPAQFQLGVGAGRQAARRQVGHH